MKELLKERFGHSEFRPGQREVIEILKVGRPALAVFPTGGGKSLCYQLPAIGFDGLTLVISPLIALMKDQVDAMLKVDVAAARLDSSLEANEVQEIYAAMQEGSLKLLYVAPERLANEGFLNKLRKTQLSMIAIDEAHCISEWGHNFRPDYLKLGKLTRELGVKRVLALTATATPRVSEDIRRGFGIAEEDHIQTGFRRPNLRFMVTPVETEHRQQLLITRLRKRETGPAIVYVTLQHTAEELAGVLQREGFKARAYHAGLPAEIRAEAQDLFMNGEVDVIVATIAFGMGIDKADIRYIYHYNLPKSIENYVQETGRAGRDGNESVCEILACGDDRIVLENFAYGDTPTPNSLKQLVEHLLLQGEEFSVSQYDLSGTNDIRPLVIATVLTNLELSGLLESKGPFYAAYKFKLVEPMHRILSGHSEERQAFLTKLFQAAKKGRIWYTVDIEEAAAKIGEPTERIQKALNYLAELGEVVLQPSGLRHGYRLNPDHPREISAITQQLRELFEKSEEGEIRRIGGVIDFCESSDCLTRQLLAYFGETLEEDCGNCGNCLSEKKQQRELPCSLTDELSFEQVEMIHSIRAEKHSALKHPRQLARFLCGIRSPKSTRARLGRHDLFGCLESTPFRTVLAQVEALG
ncbi:MAG: RecQ family ATP-dependent DNA helicase [Verrucomicrobiota bacterium]